MGVEQSEEPGETHERRHEKLMGPDHGSLWAVLGHSYLIPLSMASNRNCFCFFAW